MRFYPPVQISRATWERHEAMLNRVENQVYEQRPLFNHWPRPADSFAMLDAIVNSAITPFNTNTNTYGSGTVDIYLPVFNSNTNTYNSTIVNGSINQTCINWFTNNGASISSNTHIQVYWYAGYLHYGGGDC